MKNIDEKIKRVKIDIKYDINAEDLRTILENCNGDIVLALINSFKIGYLQGSRAKKAKLRSRK